MGMRGIPLTLWLGLLIVLLCEGMLFVDVRLSHRGALHSQSEINALREQVRPVGSVARTARWVAVNMTALVWLGYLVFLEGVLTWQKGKSPIRQRPHHFLLLCLASISIWCVFDWVNFYSIQAWRYIGMPKHFRQRGGGYFLAFATIVPGMLMSGQALLNAGVFEWARRGEEEDGGWRMEDGKRHPPSSILHLPSSILLLSLLCGAAMFLWPLVHHDPVTNLTLWCSLVFLLDPINYWLGRPSMFRDWFNGNFARTLAAFSGGLLCGFLWEFWNYWALAKWTYHLPFLGKLEGYRYFEMPLPGLLGFLPFGLECWVMWQTMRILLDGLAEPLPDDQCLL
jgi:hypothetical protein